MSDTEIVTADPAVSNDLGQGGDATMNGGIDSRTDDPCQNGNDPPPLPRNDNNNGNDDVRIGTISSARFNILSTMVGGGCLSLPMAFQKSGNALLGPLLLLVTGVITEFCFRTLVASAIVVKQPHRTRPGNDTFESITSEAFGPKACVLSAALVFFMCFFGAVGYAVLLRDMLAPLNHAIAPERFSEWFRHNFSMFAVIGIVTPFCTLRQLTALKDCGLASMMSLLILGSCIVFRSVQCNCTNNSGDDPWYSHLSLLPDSWRDVLDALPLYISCFVCHYNILPVHNELKDPSPARVNWWLRSTTWFSVGLYMVMGFAGSAYAPCTATGKISGNILLDFDENDPLLMVGRMCLAVTITLAFPMLVIPARAVVVRSLILPRLASASVAASEEDAAPVTRSVDEELQEPLLASGNDSEEPGPLEPDSDGGRVGTADDNHNDDDDDDGDSTAADISSASSTVLVCTSVIILWSMATLASVVSSIEVVWDLLGSSLSIILSYLIPAGTFLVITKRGRQNESDGWISRAVCWLLIYGFVPLMVVSTINAVYNTFS